MNRLVLKIIGASIVGFICGGSLLASIGAPVKQLPKPKQSLPVIFNSGKEDSRRRNATDEMQAARTHAEAMKLHLQAATAFYNQTESEWQTLQQTVRLGAEARQISLYHLMDSLEELSVGEKVLQDRTFVPRDVFQTLDDFQQALHANETALTEIIGRLPITLGYGAQERMQLTQDITIFERQIRPEYLSDDEHKALVRHAKQLGQLLESSLKMMTLIKTTTSQTSYLTLWQRYAAPEQHTQMMHKLDELYAHTRDLVEVNTRTRP